MKNKKNIVLEENVKKLNHYHWYCKHNEIDVLEDSSLLEYIEYVVTKGNNVCKTMLYKLRAVDNSIELQDVVQEIFINLFRYPVNNREYTPNIITQSFSKYIRNFFFKKRYLKDGLVELDANELEKEDLSQNQIDKILCSELIGSLTEDEKRLIHLYYYDGLSIRDIGKKLNLVFTTVDHRLKKTIEKLRTRV